jgi:hypothetical protein
MWRLSSSLPLFQIAPNKTDYLGTLRNNVELAEDSVGEEEKVNFLLQQGALRKCSPTSISAAQFCFLSLSWCLGFLAVDYFLMTSFSLPSFLQVPLFLCQSNFTI